MASNTRSPLHRETLDTLRELIRYNFDSRDGLKEAAAQIEHPTLARLFRELAEERAAQAGELQAFVARHGGDAKVSGHPTAALQRLWMEIRATVAAGDAYAVLAECERGEDTLKEAYERTREAVSDEAVAEILQRHQRAVDAAHDRIRDLRDQHKKP